MFAHIPGLEAVIVSSTPNMHDVQAKAALDRSLHVLIEKPMTFTAAEARELVEIAAARCVELVISCAWHFTAHGIMARHLIAGGSLGRIKMISVLMTNPLDRLLKCGSSAAKPF
jgi:predicted dehydrogenase